MQTSTAARATSAHASRFVAAATSPMAWDVVAICALVALWALLMPFRYPALPLQLWDESRNANNALEMALHGARLAPTYAGLVDHWNTKPPLLIWLQAGLLRSGAAPLVALRAPSWLAAAATAGMLWAVPRYALQDKAAGVASALLLLGAGLYLGPHAARTGDYDALESAFVLACVLAAWRGLEDGRGAWLAAAGVLAALGVLTKGVAALLPAPGLALYALTRPRHAMALAKSPLAWGGAALFALLVGGYYLARERVDPGYLSVMAANEIGGRFLKVAENHQGGAAFYLALLGRRAEPCAAFALLAALPLCGPDGPRRRLTVASALATASLLGVISVSRSKLEWYAVPLVPLLALLGGVGLSDLVRRLPSRGPIQPGAALVAALALAAGVVDGLGQAQACPQRCPAWVGGAALRQGEFLEAVRRLGSPGTVTILDGGFHNDAGFSAYDPMLKFYAGLQGSRGLAVRAISAPRAWTAAERVGGCGTAVTGLLARDPRLSPELRTDGCTLFRAAPVAGAPR